MFAYYASAHFSTTAEKDLCGVVMRYIPMVHGALHQDPQQQQKAVDYLNSAIENIYVKNTLNFLNKSFLGKIQNKINVEAKFGDTNT